MQNHTGDIPSWMGTRYSELMSTVRTSQKLETKQDDSHSLSYVMTSKEEIHDLRRRIRELNTRCSFLSDITQKYATDVKTDARMAIYEYKKHIQSTALGGENAVTEQAVANIVEEKWKEYFSTPSAHVDSSPREVYTPTIPFASSADRIDKLTSRFARHETLSTYIHSIFLRLFYLWGHFWVCVLCFILQIDRAKVYESSKEQRKRE